ncbi:MAG: hypothetical protein MJZ23_00765 [Paludibacteraceae bacterium]|nr:hypothetical protein [Paludibacteraceae bacterium]
METREDYILKNFAKAVGCLALLPVIDLICYFIQNSVLDFLCMLLCIRLIFEVAVCVKHVLVDEAPQAQLKTQEVKNVSKE